MRLPELTAEQWDALRERDRRSEFEAAALAGYDSDPAGATARERLTNFIAWRDRTASELAALQSKRQSMQSMVDAPATVAAKRDGLLKSLARRLLGGEEIVDHDEQAALDSELRSSKRKAAVAQVALAELDTQIDVKQLQVRRLSERENGFARDALLEHINITLGPQYHKAVGELRRVMKQIDAARRAGDMVGLSITIPENRRQRVENFFQLPELGILKHAEAMISSADNDAVAPWRDMIKSWGVEQRTPRSWE